MFPDVWKSVDGSEGRISFEYLIDASGRNGLMSVKYLKNRRFQSSLKNIAVWGYWIGTSKYMPGSDRDNAVYIEALNGTCPITTERGTLISSLFR